MRIKFSLVISFIILITLCSCQEQKKAENGKGQLARTDSLQVAVMHMKSAVSQLDSALIEITKLNNTDSIKNDLMSRDQDMVRIYKVEEPPIVDTLAGNRDALKTEASRILDRARALIAAANQQIRQQQAIMESDTLNSTKELKQAVNEQIESVRALILKVEHETERLEGEIKKTGNM